jgi:Tol biopolymer transport system component
MCALCVLLCQWAFSPIPAELGGACVGKHSPGPARDGECRDTAVIGIQDRVTAAIPNGEHRAAHGAPNDVLGDTWRVSVSSLNGQGNRESGGRNISGDGRHVVFYSNASNLVPGDTNSATDIFVHDRLTGVTERVSVSSDGDQVDKDSRGQKISLDGRRVAFASNATNLVAGDTNGVGDVFVHDRATHETIRVSVSSGGDQANRRAWRPNISGDGRYVSFASEATNLVPNDTNGQADIFVHDCITGETWGVSSSPSGEQGNGSCEYSALSADGRFVAFGSTSSNLVPGDTNRVQDIFIRDMATNEMERVNVSSSGVQAHKGSWQPEVSADGRYVAYVSAATNLVPDDTNGTWDVFVRDRRAGETERVSISSDGAEGNGFSGESQIGADGRWVVFRSAASNLVPGDTNRLVDIFVRDRVSQTTVRVSVSAIGQQADGESDDPSISADGRYVAFRSCASNLVPDDTNGGSDSFARQVLAGDVMVSAPQGWFNAGWNWFSIPLDPAGWTEASHLLGFDCGNNLFGWDPVGKVFWLYRDDFVYPVRGRGYLLRLTGDENPSYDALEPTGDFEIALPEAGWTWIGHPFADDRPLDACFVRNNGTGQIRTAEEDFRAPDGWVNWNLLWWLSALDSWGILGLVGGDDDTLHPWYGYLVWSNERGLTLIVPAD